MKFQEIMSISDIADAIQLTMSSMTLNNIVNANHEVDSLCRKIKILEEKRNFTLGCDFCTGSRRIETLVSDPYNFKYCPMCGKFLNG